MPPLKMLKDSTHRLKPTLGYLQSGGRNDTKARTAAAPWRAWYRTARWQKLRWQILTRDLFTCRMCGQVVGDTSRLVADHIEPHRGDEKKFYDPANLQCLCKSCHDGPKQRAEANGAW